MFIHNCVMTCIDADGCRCYANGMENKKPLAIKIDPELLRRLDRFIKALTYGATRTGVIETFIKQGLDREEKKGERK